MLPSIPVATPPTVPPIRVTPWAPGSDETWPRLVDALDHATLAHAPQWFDAIQAAYGHTPLFLQATDSLGRVAVLPAFVIRRPLLGAVVVSMPFLDYGGPLSSRGDLARHLVEYLMKEAGRLSVRAVEFRCTEALNLPFSPMTNKVNLVLPLPGDPGELWRRLDPKVRNQVRKAERSSLTVEVGRAEILEDFYRVFAANMRELGSPVHGRKFFAAILDSFGGKARVAVVRKGPLPIGGLIALSFKQALIVPWASSLREYFPLCPNVLLYWEMLRAACREGFRRFEFGRSGRNSGTYRFKRQWGAIEEPLYWYKLLTRGHDHRPLSRSESMRTVLAALWRRLPLPASRWFGPRIRKYLTQ